MGCGAALGPYYGMIAYYYGMAACLLWGLLWPRHSRVCKWGSGGAYYGMEALIPFPPHPIILGSLCVGDGGGGRAYYGAGGPSS